MEIPMSGIDPNGATALVTGAASGIGRSTVLALAAAGARVIAADRQAVGLKALADETLRLGTPIDTAVLDVTDAEAVAALADCLEQSGRTPDILINNAGIGWLGGLFETPPDVWRRVLEVNLYGVLNGCQAFGPRMVAAGGRRLIVNIASLASIMPAANMAAYAASKSAVEGLTTVLGMELARTDVDVMCVHPGIINTPIVSDPSAAGASISPGQLQRLQAYYQAKGCHPDAVASAIVKGIRRGSAKVFTGPQAPSTALLKRLLPHRLMSALGRSASRQAGFLP